MENHVNLEAYSHEQRNGMSSQNPVVAALFTQGPSPVGQQPTNAS